MDWKKWKLFLTVILVGLGLFYAGSDAIAAFTYNVSDSITVIHPNVEARYTYTFTKTGDTTIGYIDIEIPKDIFLREGTNLPAAGDNLYSVTANNATLGVVDINGIGVGDTGTKFGIGDTRYRVMKINLNAPTAVNSAFTITLTLKGQDFIAKGLNLQFATQSQCEFGSILVKAGNGTVTTTFNSAHTPTLVPIPPTPPPPNPVISFFSVTNPVIALDNIIFTWSVANATSGYISWIDNGHLMTQNVAVTSGKQIIPAPATPDNYLYTITFTNLNSSNGMSSSQSQSANVQVDSPPPAPLIETTCEQIRKNMNPPKCLNVCYELVNGVTQSIMSADLYNDSNCATDPNPTPLRVFKLNDPEKSIVCLPCNYQGSLPGAPVCPANGDPAQGMPYHAVINLQHKNCDVFNYERQNLGATVVLGTDPWRFVNGSMVWFP